MNKQTYLIESSIFLLVIVLLISCSSISRYQILSSVFDGVPNPNEKQNTLSDTTKVDSLSVNNNGSIVKNKKPEFVYHPPYRNRMCAGCHDMQRGNSLIKPTPELCYKCHENITEENPALHGRVAMDECKTCHSPHFAKYKFLLVREGRDLCLYCHETTYVYENKNHFATKELGCLDCHNPHSRKDRFLLNLKK